MMLWDGIESLSYLDENSGISEVSLLLHLLHNRLLNRCRVHFCDVPRVVTLSSSEELGKSLKSRAVQSKDECGW